MRKVLGGIAVVVVIVAAWWRWPHHDAPANKPAAPRPLPPAPAHAAKTDSDHPSPRGTAPKWTLDVDPEGPLRLEGQVVGADGRGIGGAEVWLGSVPPRQARTEDDGSFAFDKLVGRTYELTASAGTRTGGPVSYKLTGSSDPVVIALGEGASVDVTVSDASGQAIQGADVKVPDRADPTVKTDDHGKALITGLHPGWIAIEAEAPGYAPGSNVTSIGSAGGKGALAITLRKGAAVAGRVVDEAGHPLARVHVTAGDAADWWSDRGHAEQTTDDKGEFAFAALAPGSHTLSAIDGEHAPASSTPITVRADHPVAGVQIVMKAGAVVSGTVVDRDGTPVPYATVKVAGKGPEMWRIASRQATSDHRGKFALRGLARAQLQARAESDSAASQIADVDLASGAQVTDLRLVLDVTGTIAGTVVDEVGAPVAEVEVNAFPDLLAGASTEGLALAGMSSTTTDGAGGFVIRGVPDGSYRLWAARHATGFDEGWGKQSTPARAGDKGVRIVLPASGRVVGKLALDNGSAPTLAYVRLGVVPSTPASAGAFAIEDVAPGTYDLEIVGPEFAQLVKHDVKIEPGKTTDLGTIAVGRGRQLIGRVVDATGTPVAGASVKLGVMLFDSAEPSDAQQSYDDMSGIRTATTDQDGAFTLTGVPAKQTTVMATHPDRGQSLAMTVPGGADDPPTITLALRGYGSIVGTVTSKGQPVGGATISDASKGGGAQAAFAETAADGTFTLAKVPEGTHVLLAMQQQLMSMKSTSVTVQVTAGKQSTVAIDIPVGQVSLQILIKALPGNEVDAAQVLLFQGNVAMTSAEQLMNGFFQNAVQGMKLWFGPGKPLPVFDELVPGGYTACAIPLTGDLNDPQFQQRLQENMSLLKVYCKPVQVAASPALQTFEADVPAMVPLPTPKS
ncbi:MAG TPA: carboxypeptidase regulatory-like domain-containing protein [Kofleriaceae bacterium]|nr:carboxypeptidase regulatory-like domain-containing protein [Kofleriaceae bacterium]